MPDQPRREIREQTDLRLKVERWKTDEELEQERKEARRRDEENSYRDVSAIYPSGFAISQTHPFTAGTPI